jgi:hypothetical protein
VPGAAPAKPAPVDERTLARCKELVGLIKGPEPVIDADGCLDVPPKNVVAMPTAVGVVETAEMLERAGLGMGKTESYRVALAIKNLAEDDNEKVTSCKFWGKIYGTKADYLIAETTTGPRGTLPECPAPPSASRSGALSQLVARALTACVCTPDRVHHCAADG